MYKPCFNGFSKGVPRVAWEVTGFRVFLEGSLD